MSQSNGTLASKRTYSSAGLFFLLAAGGLAGNCFRYEVFFTIQFLFGSICAMLALQMLGPVRGIVIGLLASLVTWPLWNHPWAMVIMAGETVCVALLFHRRQPGLVLADTLYWLLLGIPLVFLLYHGVMEPPADDIMITAFVQAVNGLCNTLVARLFFMAVSRYFGAGTFSFREVVFNIFLFFLLIPSLLLLALQSRSDIRASEQAVRGALEYASRRVAAGFDSWLDENRRDLSFLAGIATKHPVREMQEHFDAILVEDGNLLHVGLMDESARSVAFAPETDHQGQSTIGTDYSDRPYLPELKSRLAPMLTEVMMGRVAPPRPIAALVVPVLKEGRFAGFVSGILDLERLREILELNTLAQTLPGVLYTLTDRSGRVIATNREGLRVMEPFSRGEGRLVKLSGGVSEWLPPARNAFLPSGGRTVFFVAEHRIGELAEWTLALDQPLAPFQQRLYEQYGRHFIEIFFMLLAAMALAHLVSRRLVAALAELAGISRDLPGKLSAGEDVVWPLSRLKEAVGLTANFREMAGALALQFRAVREMNLELEQRIEERTRELRASEVRFRSMFENVKVVSLLIDPENSAIVDANAAAEAFYGWPRAKLKSMRITDINVLPIAMVLAEMEQAVREERNFFLFRHRRADGVERDVEVYSGPIPAEDGRQLLYSIVQDVTERRAAELALKEKTGQLEELTKGLERRVEKEIDARRKSEQLLAQQSKLAAMGEMLGAIAHQWRQPLNTLALCVQNVRDAWQYGELDGAFLDATTEKSLAQVRHMSRTIDDFRNFFLPDKKKSVFDTMVAAGEVVTLFAPQLAAHGIGWELFCHVHGQRFTAVSDVVPCAEKMVEGYHNEFEHVLLNLVGNAKDAILEKQGRGGFAPGEEGRIRLEFSRRGERLVIRVSDNGGGIPEALIDRVFEPYFTTKGPGSGPAGTGIGLYMAKTIVEEHMQGRLYVENEADGAAFTIELPAIARTGETRENGHGGSQGV